MIARVLKSSHRCQVSLNSIHNMSRHSSSKLHPSKKVATQEADVWTITYPLLKHPGSNRKQEYSCPGNIPPSNPPRTRIYEVSPLLTFALNMGDNGFLVLNLLSSLFKQRKMH